MSRATTDEVLDTFLQTRDYKETATIHGMTYEAVRKRVKRNLPPGATTHIRDGAIVQQWLRTPKQPLEPEDFVQALKDALSDYKPPAPLKTPQRPSKNGLLGKIDLFDLHMGMRAWNRETGGPDWDIQIAKNVYQRGITELAGRLPRCEKGVVLIGGDLTHADNYHQGTSNPNTHHVVDVDGRYPKIFRASVDIVIFAVDRALEFADKVEVVLLPGNHDAATAAGVSYCLELHYRKSNRVDVVNSDSPHWCLEWGKTMLAASHGDTLTMKRFGPSMAEKWAPAWGRTKYRYGFIGHLHQKVVESHPGVQIEVCPTPCAPDSYAAKHGYSALRMFQAMVFCRDRGLRTTENVLL